MKWTLLLINGLVVSLVSATAMVYNVPGQISQQQGNFTLIQLTVTVKQAHGHYFFGLKFATTNNSSYTVGLYYIEDAPFQIFVAGSGCDQRQTNLGSGSCYPLTGQWSVGKPYRFVVTQDQPHGPTNITITAVSEDESDTDATTNNPSRGLTLPITNLALDLSHYQVTLTPQGNHCPKYSYVSFANNWYLGDDGPWYDAEGGALADSETTDETPGNAEVDACFTNTTNFRFSAIGTTVNIELALDDNPGNPETGAGIIG